MADIDQTDDLENGATITPLSNPYEKIKFCFSAKDLKNPVLTKRLIYENENLKREVAQLEQIEKDYYQSKENVARYEEREKKNWAYAIFRDFFMTLSGVFFGLISHDFSRENPFNWIMLVLAIIILMEVILSYYLPYMKKKGGVVWIYQ